MPAPFALFCSDPLDPKAVDPAFQGEVGAAREAGFSIVRLDHDELDHRIDPDAALRGARFDEEGTAVYRGWMLRAEAYAALSGSLAKRGINLVASAEEYAACHHGPGSYRALSEWMPKTTWLSIDQIDDVGAIEAALAEFGAAPVILKDWVKSQASGYWEEACFIPDASETDRALRVVSRFRELQGDSLVGGLVFKSYVSLIPGGSPAHEFRAFIVRGRAVGCWPRSPDAMVLGGPPAALLSDVAAKVPSPFASADFGRDESGRWWLLEVGDGQVSGLPDPDAATAIFSALGR